jgi:hypothetical protein
VGEDDAVLQADEPEEGKIDEREPDDQPTNGVTEAALSKRPDEDREGGTDDAKE